MKKLFSLLFVALLAMSAWADTVVTVDFSAQGWDNGQLVTEAPLVVDGVTLTFDKGEGTTKPAYYTTGSAVRLYAGNTMTVTAPTNLKKIDFTFASGEDSNDILSNPGNYNKAGKQWTIGSSDPSNEVTFSIDKKTGQANYSGHRRVQKLVITMEDSEPVTELVPPVFNPNGGDFTGSLEVTLSCATENAQIFWFYGTEEDQGTHFYYNGPIYLTETATLTAYSVKGDDMSDYVTVTFTKAELTVEAPEFTPESCYFKDRLEVTLTCATPNAKIYYSLDNDLWSQYVDPIPVTDDLTIWAKAAVGDVESEVVSATYTKLPPSSEELTFDGAVDKGTGDVTRHSYTVVKEPVTMFVGDGTVYDTHYRIYKSDSAALTFTSTGRPIIRIEFNGMSSYTASGLSKADGNDGNWTTSGTDGVWEGISQFVAFNVNQQVRCTTIIVTLAGDDDPTFIRGDVDGSSGVNISDVTVLIDYILSGDPTGVNLDAADCDENGSINIGDLTALIDYILSQEW